MPQDWVARNDAALLPAALTQAQNLFSNLNGGKSPWLETVSPDARHRDSKSRATAGA